MVAISMDEVGDAVNMAAHVDASFPVLADADGAVTRGYGVYDLLGDGLAAPATFIVGKDGAIQWSYIGQDAADRPTAADILERLESL